MGDGVRGRGRCLRPRGETRDLGRGGVQSRGAGRRGWEEDRAGPLALPQREAAEDHGSYSIQRSAVQFLLCLLSIMDPIPRDSL